MHKTDDFSIDQVSKVEGHAALDIKVRNKKVQYVRFKVEENKRFYTKAIRGKEATNLHQMTSRICGTCSIAHMTCCVHAVEDALNIQPTEQTRLLRQLSVNSLMIRDHALHLYFFCLPDLFRVDSILELAEKKKDLVHQALHVKDAGNNMGKIIAGRAVHPLFYTLGGFIKAPTNDDVKKVIKELKSVRSYALSLLDIFLKCDFDLSRDSVFLSLMSDDFNFLDGYIESSKGLCIPKYSYSDYLDREVLPYSQALGYKFEDDVFMLGAIARVNLNKDSLHRNTRRDCSLALKEFPSENIFDNNLAQALEIIHCIDSSIDILEASEFRKEAPVEPKQDSGQGVGVMEAPRGTLFYRLDIDKGIVKSGDIITPTQQNQIKIERDVAYLLPSILNKSREEIQWEIEKIVRAYDPCLSCASHFLKLNWI
jgi:sulfhydrogenase subunit alpha